MKKWLFLIICLLIGGYALQADESPGGDEDFVSQLDDLKNPFENGIPKPVVVVPEPVYTPPPKPVVKPRPVPKPVARPVPVEIVLPDLKLQGVMVGDQMHQAIINDAVVPVGGTIKDARVISVTKQGVELLFKGKKFFIKVD